MGVDCMTKYNLIDKTTRPEFDYILLSGNYWTKYYLYRSDEFEDAYNQLKSEFAKGFKLAVLCEPSFNTNSREWRAHPLFKSTHKKKTEVFYDPYLQTMLHLKWYCDAGEWLNPRDSWDDEV